MRSLFAIVILVASGLAGCSEESFQTEPQPSTTPSPIPTTDPGPEDGFSLYGSECIYTDSFAVAPRGSMGGEVPPEWARSDDPDPFDNAYYHFFECNRIGFLELERPVSLIMEAHGQFSMPPNCGGSQLDFIMVLHRLYVNDTALAAKLGTIGMPVEAATIDGEIRPTGGTASEFRWTWSVGDHPISDLTEPSPFREFTPFDLSHVTRFVWFVNETVHYLDMDMTLLTSHYNSSTQYGHMYEPMLFARSGLPFYVARAGDIADGASFTGAFGAFGDLTCETPA